jgi:hypothetical protein
VKHQAEVLRIRHIPFRKVRIETGATIKDSVKVGRLRHIPSRKVCIETATTAKHSVKVMMMMMMSDLAEPTIIT